MPTLLAADAVGKLHIPLRRQNRHALCRQHRTRDSWCCEPV